MRKIIRSFHKIKMKYSFVITNICIGITASLVSFFLALNLANILFLYIPSDSSNILWPTMVTIVLTLINIILIRLFLKWLTGYFSRFKKDKSKIDILYFLTAAIASIILLELYFNQIS